jgi:hypothetical protein
VSLRAIVWINLALLAWLIFFILGLGAWDLLYGG